MALNCVASAVRCVRPPVAAPLVLAGRAAAAAGVPIIQAATITGKTIRGAPKSWKHEPWPYKEKLYSGLKSFFDSTRKRFDENTRLIVVDGPPAAGKETVARALAEEFEMVYMPPASDDLRYINDYGFDLRTLNPQLPHSVQVLEMADFLKNPYDSRIGKFQMEFAQFKYSQYVDALAHILNTGQGVVMNKSVLSDFVYMEAMCKSGFISRRVRGVYRQVVQSALLFLLRPHLVVYLDVPVPEVQRRIKARNRPDEVGSPAMTESFLRMVEDGYKNQWLKNISTHSEVLMYDVSTETDVEAMVEDIQRLDFDQYGFSDEKMKDWGRNSDDVWDALRFKYTNRKNMMVNSYFNILRLDVPELVMSCEDSKRFRDVYFSVPSHKYRPGVNPEMGDSVLFNLGNYERATTRY